MQADTVSIETASSQTPRLWQTVLVIDIIIGITISEFVFAYLDVAYGILIALAITIAVYMLVSFLKLDRGIVNIGETLVLIPLYILFTASLPWFFIHQQYLLPAVYSCILALCFWHIYQKRRSVSEIFGIQKKKLLTDILLGLAIGAFTGPIEYLILRPAPAFPEFQIGYFLRDVVYMIAFVGLGEELLFRGLIQRDLSKVYGLTWGLIGASFLFAVMHLTWRSVPELFFVFLAALLMGGIYQKTKRLTASIVLHGMNNIMLVAVCPYLFKLA